MPSITTVHPVILPIDVTNRMSGGPHFSSDMTQVDDGSDHVNSNWDEALWAWAIRCTRDGADFGAVYKFFLLRRGPAFGFLFEDPCDYRHDDNDGIGAVKLFPDSKHYLCKAYGDDWSTYYRVIRTAREETLDLSGVPGTPVYHYGTGEVTGASGEGLAAFDFVVPVRFMSDACIIDREPGQGDWENVPLRELRKFVIATAP